MIRSNRRNVAGRIIEPGNRMEFYYKAGTDCPGFSFYTILRARLNPSKEPLIVASGTA